MFKCLLPNNCLLKFLVIALKSIFIVLSNIYGYTVDSILYRKTMLVVKLFPVSIMSIVICLVVGQILCRYLHYLILFLDIVFFFTALFIILYHILKEPETRLNIISAS